MLHNLATSSRGRRARLVSAAGALVLVGSAVTACGSDPDTGSAQGTTSSGGGASLRIVASTNVWGDIAKAVGGDRVEVTSIIDDPSQDPHSFQADTQTLLAISKADVVIENGGGYDDFMGTMITSADTSAAVLNAVDISGKTAPASGELNEHVWYDLPSAVLVAEKIASELGEEDAEHAAEFESNAADFEAQVQTLIDRETTEASAVSGKGIAITEPVPLYLTDALGLVDKTPPEFSEAVEEGDDVPVSVLKETTDLFSGGEVAALVYNDQTSGPVTEQVEKAAKDAGVPVVPVTETLPEGTSYVGWMTANLDAVVAAVSGS